MPHVRPKPASPSPDGARAGWVLPCAAILLLALALYVTAPMDGSFWWSDAPRHALNGIFLKDALLAAPFAHPARFAMDYYVQYPALTILFYPPLLYFISAPFFLLFGDSHATAQAVIALHGLALGCGMYALARHWMDRWAALATALLLLGLPEIALWGRQVMLEVPALCWLVWAAYFAVRHGRRQGTWSLALFAVFALFSLYTKLSMVFVVAVLALYLLLARGGRLLAERRLWIVAALAMIAMVPLILITLKFGQANVQSVSGIADTAASRRTLAGWVWYARQLPEMAGIAGLVLAAVGLAVSRTSAAWLRAERVMLGLWFVVCYLALSFIELKEARHGVILLVPLAVWAGFGLDWLARRIGGTGGLRPALAVGVAGALAAWTVAAQTVPRVDGYREAALRAAAAAPPGSAVLFSGKRDGSFIFSMRTATGRPDLQTVRADKLFLEIAVRREIGVAERAHSEAEMIERIRNLGVAVVVAQRDFWTDLAQMAQFQRVLDGPDFEEIGRIVVAANVPVEDHELRLYRITGEIRPRPRESSIDLPIIGRSIEGGSR